jgi:hypothetical protein
LLMRVRIHTENRALASAPGPATANAAPPDAVPPAARP